MKGTAPVASKQSSGNQSGGNQPSRKQSNNPEQRRADDLNRALDQITKDFGKGAIMRLGDDRAIAQRLRHLRPAPSRSTSPSASAEYREGA